MDRTALIAALVAMWVSWGAPAKSAELVMFRQALCDWCEVWDKEIGGVYHKTPEGRSAPLRQLDIRERRPVELQRISPVVFTPTFVLMHEGREVGRIMGYPGEAFFWELLDKLIERLPKGQ